MLQQELNVLGEKSRANGIAESAFHACNLPAALQLTSRPLARDADSTAHLLDDKYRDDDYYKREYRDDDYYKREYRDDDYYKREYRDDDYCKRGYRDVDCYKRKYQDDDYMYDKCEYWDGDYYKRDYTLYMYVSRGTTVTIVSLTGTTSVYCEMD